MRTPGVVFGFLIKNPKNCDFFEKKLLTLKFLYGILTPSLTKSTSKCDTNHYNLIVKVYLSFLLIQERNNLANKLFIKPVFIASSEQDYLMYDIFT